MSDEHPVVASMTGAHLTSSTAIGSGPTVGRRTRVVLADVDGHRRERPATAELSQQSPVGEALLRGLIRTQLAHALRLAAVVLVGLGGLPLLFAAAPMVAGARLFGASIPWLILGLAAYPFLFAVGATYVRLAERTETDFTDLVGRPDR